MADHSFRGTAIEFRPLERQQIPRLTELLNHPQLHGRRYLPEEVPEDAPLSEATVEKVVSAWEERKESFRFGVYSLETGSLIGHAGCDWGWDPQKE